MADLDDLYGDAILDHCRHPRNHDRLESPEISGRAVNPFCGDEVDLQIVVESGIISRVGVQAAGCSINQASASMLSEALAGKTVDDALQLSDLFRRAMGGSEPSEEELRRLGGLSALFGVQRFPVRIKCSLLALSALAEGIEDYRKQPAV